MSVSKEEREAYEAGQRERESQGSPLHHMLSPDERPSDDDLSEAYTKGLEGEQLDADRND